MAARCAPGEPLAMRDTSDQSPDGYCLAMAESAPYAHALDADTTLHELRGDDGKPIVAEKGTTIVDACYLSAVTGGAQVTREMPRWYTPYPQGDARGKVRVPTHMILMAGFSMPAATNVPGAKAWVDPKGKDPAYPGGPLTAAQSKAQGKWGVKYMRVDAVAKGAVVLPDDVHAAIMDELDTRAAASQ